MRSGYCNIVKRCVYSIVCAHTLIPPNGPSFTLWFVFLSLQAEKSRVTFTKNVNNIPSQHVCPMQRQYWVLTANQGTHSDRG